MKKLFVFTIIFAMLVSSAGIIASAAGETPLTMSLTRPTAFVGAESVEFESSRDNAGMLNNQQKNGDVVLYDYIFLKKDTSPDPYARIEFEVDADGKYDFCIELMAYKSTLPRTSLVQIDDGAKYYVRSEHGERHLITEYYTGLTAELKAGKHTMTVYLADDFDNTTVKSLYFDKFSFVAQGTEPDNKPVDSQSAAPADSKPADSKPAQQTEKITEKAQTAAPTTDKAPAKDEVNTPIAPIIIGVVAAVIVVGAIVIIIKKKK